MNIEDILTYDVACKVFVYDPHVGSLYWNQLGLKELGMRKRLSYPIPKIFSYDKRTVHRHRVIFLLMTGEWPSEFVDHINGNQDDNRWCNLRHASPLENARNVRLSKRNTSGRTGVYYQTRRKTWTAQITVKRKNIRLGTYKTFDEAVAARLAAEQLHYGEFAPSVCRSTMA